MTRRINVLMIQNTTGAVDGIHIMQFEKEKIYKVDPGLADVFFDKNVAALASVVPKGSKVYVMHMPKVSAQAFSYGIPKPEAQPYWKQEEVSEE